MTFHQILYIPVSPSGASMCCAAESSEAPATMEVAAAGMEAVSSAVLGAVGSVEQALGEARAKVGASKIGGLMRRVGFLPEPEPEPVYQGDTVILDYH